MTDATPPLTRRELRLRAEAAAPVPVPLTRRQLREQEQARAAEARHVAPPSRPDVDEMFAAASSFTPPPPPPLTPTLAEPVATVQPEPAPVAPRPEPAEPEQKPASGDPAVGTTEPTDEQGPAAAPLWKGDRRPRAWWHPVVQLLTIVILAGLLVVAVKAFALRTFTVTSESMAPELATGDHLLIEMVSPRFTPYDTGDVVVFTDSADWLGDGDHTDSGPNVLHLLGLVPESEGYLVKRVIGVPFDTVEGLADGTVLVNGYALDEPYAQHAPQDPFIYTLGPGQYWVMGDNRPISADSRMHGPIGEGDLVGRAWVTLSPAERFGLVD